MSTSRVFAGLLGLRPVPVVAGTAAVWAVPGLILLGFAARPGQRPARRSERLEPPVGGRHGE